MSEQQARDFIPLIEKHSRRLFNLLYRLTGDYHAAQDLSQDVWLAAFKDYHRFQGRSDVYTWLYRIAVNRFKKYHHGRKLRNWFGLDQVSEEAAITEMPGGLEADQQSQAVARAVSALPPDFRTVITLFYFEEQDCRKISDILGCSEGTVKSRLWRGRQILAKKLKGFAMETGALP
jgi:RNA polymerase sigma-70 factor (ECF subfamily)